MTMHCDHTNYHTNNYFKEREDCGGGGGGGGKGRGKRKGNWREGRGRGMGRSFYGKMSHWCHPAWVPHFGPLPPGPPLSTSPPPPPPSFPPLTIIIAPPQFQKSILIITLFQAVMSVMLVASCCLVCLNNHTIPAEPKNQWIPMTPTCVRLWVQLVGRVDPED